jgi:WhiB family redox-sensing transcriptional regulator
MMRNLDWQAEAACHGVDPEVFFPSSSLGLVGLQVERAKEVCQACPVTRECLDLSLAAGHEIGVWGGLSEHERRSLSRRSVRRVTWVA